MASRFQIKVKSANSRIIKEEFKDLQSAEAEFMALIKYYKVDLNTIERLDLSLPIIRQGENIEKEIKIILKKL